MITVFAVMTAKVGQKEEVLMISRANLAVVRAEKGCHEYRLVEDTKELSAFQTPLGKDSFAFIEGWESMQALEAHLATPHMKAYFEETAPFIESSAIHVLKSAE